MAIPFFDLKTQYQEIKTEIDSAIRAVFDSGQFIGGDFVRQFESDFAKLHRADFCIGAANGTDAILIALKSLGITQGDEIITPAFGWISASEMISLSGAVPVFADVLPSGVLDPEKVESKISQRTKGVIAMHLYGQAAPATPIKKICDQHGLFLIEDCAQAHLTTDGGKPVGTVGAAGTFSFYPTKNLGAYGDGGCVITNDKALAARMRAFANHGGINIHTEEGINSRLDPIQAAVLSVKLKHVREWTAKRILNASLYFSKLKGIGDLVLPAIRPDSTHTFHQFVVRTKHRNALRDFLASHEIETSVHYPKALHFLPAYAKMNHKADDFPNSLECQEQVLSLPVYPELTESQITIVAEKIKLYFSAR